MKLRTPWIAFVCIILALFVFGCETDDSTSPGTNKPPGTATTITKFLGMVATQGYWTSIAFHSNNPANQLVYTEIGHGCANDYADVYVFYHAAVTVSNSSIHDSATWGIYVDDEATATISNNSYANNAAGDVSQPGNR